MAPALVADISLCPPPAALDEARGVISSAAVESYEPRLAELAVGTSTTSSPGWTRTGCGGQALESEADLPDVDGGRSCRLGPFPRLRRNHRALGAVGCSTLPPVVADSAEAAALASGLRTSSVTLSVTPPRRTRATTSVASASRTRSGRAGPLGFGTGSACTAPQHTERAFAQSAGARLDRNVGRLTP